MTGALKFNQTGGYRLGLVFQPNIFGEVICIGFQPARPGSAKLQILPYPVFWLQYVRRNKTKNVYRALDRRGTQTLNLQVTPGALKLQR
jgi:hypothetical protein